MNQPQQPQRAPLGAEHAKLEGAPALFRFRPKRRLSSDVRGHLLCDFVVEGRRRSGVAVHDISSTGFSLRSEDELLPGTTLDDLCLTLDGTDVWSGKAEVVHSGAAGLGMMGCRLISGVLDMEELHFRSDSLNSRLIPALEEVRESEQLPAGWRADVAKYVRLFALAREILDDAQQDRADWRDQRVSQALCRSLYDALIPEVEAVVRRLAGVADGFDGACSDLALSYTTAASMVEFREGEFLRRAYEKPLGYAGDYWMMELLQMDELRGDSLYQRFLHMYVRDSAMGLAVRKRGKVAQRRLADLADSGGPVRIMSLACGPAWEVRELLRTHPHFADKFEIILVDQDDRALRRSYEGVMRALGDRADHPPVEVHSLHFSLRQIIAPRSAAERELVESVLRGVDLIYSMGMFDYLPQSRARRAASSLYELLRPGGSLFIGNLMRVPESSWVMESCTAWNLVYRDQKAMLDLASSIEPLPQQVDLVRDAGACLFLDVRRDS